jgi:hypothetical protein
MSFRSFPRQGIWMGSSSSGTGRGMEPGFGIMQALGRSLESSMADQELNAARLEAGIQRRAWQTSGATC